MTLLEIVDQFLDLWVSEEINCLPGPIPADMATGRKVDDWSYWAPIQSTVTPEELAQLETELGTLLPPQYKSILQHKHFMELQVLDVGFFAHPCPGWQDSVKEHVFHGWPYELLLGRGFLPFASYSDWGLWCFATQERDAQGECPVYLWDHDRPDQFQLVSENLEAALQIELARERA